MTRTGEFLSPQCEDKLRWHQVFRMTEFLAPELQDEVIAFGCPQAAREHLMAYVKAKARAVINEKKRARILQA